MTSHESAELSALLAPLVAKPAEPTISMNASTVAGAGRGDACGVPHARSAKDRDRLPVIDAGVNVQRVGR